MGRSRKAPNHHFKKNVSEAEGGVFSISKGELIVNAQRHVPSEGRLFICLTLQKPEGNSCFLQTPFFLNLQKRFKRETKHLLRNSKRYCKNALWTKAAFNPSIPRHSPRVQTFF